MLIKLINIDFFLYYINVFCNLFLAGIVLFTFIVLKFIDIIYDKKVIHRH